jgi:hypothetical protein
MALKFAANKVVQYLIVATICYKAKTRTVSKKMSTALSR